jgi:Ca-activated chloride channel family protein
MAAGGTQLGSCPLKHTDVQTEISGYIARVTVKQVFQNPFKDKIEAVYTFPLSENGAVDEMQMKVGARVIKGSNQKTRRSKTNL